METKLTCIKCGKRVDYLCCELCKECSLCSIAKELRQQRDDLLATCEEGLHECERVKMHCTCKWKDMPSLLLRIERIEAAIKKAQ